MNFQSQYFTSITIAIIAAIESEGYSVYFFSPAFVPYFKWILPLFERKGEKKREVGCRENSLCRGAVMKGRGIFLIFWQCNR